LSQQSIFVNLLNEQAPIARSAESQESFPPRKYRFSQKSFEINKSRVKGLKITAKTTQRRTTCFIKELQSNTNDSPSIFRFGKTCHILEGTICEAPHQTSNMFSHLSFVQTQPRVNCIIMRHKSCYCLHEQHAHTWHCTFRAQTLNCTEKIKLQEIISGININLSSAFTKIDGLSEAYIQRICKQ